MKLAPRIKLVALLFLLGVHALRAEFVLTLVPSSTSANVGTDIHYSISVTNGFGVTQPPITVSLEFPTNLTLRAATNNLFIGVPPIGAVEDTPTSMIFRSINNYPAGRTNQFGVTLRATTAGVFTIRARLEGTGVLETTNVNLNVSNGQADLGVSISGLPNVALAFDLVSYNLTVTNRGPSAAPSVILTNLIPPNASEIFNSAGSISTITSNQIVWNLGTLTNASGRTIRMVVQPVTNGNFALNASVGGREVTDIGSDNILTNLLVVQPILTNNLALTRGTMTFNRNTALIEETVTVRNTGSTGFAGGVRIFVAGMESPHRLFNVAGTNGLTPYVAMTNGILAGETVPVKMQYYFKDRTPRSLILTAVQGPSLTTNIPPVGLGATNIAFSATNDFLTLNIPAAAGRTYTIQYSDVVPFPTNAATLRTLTATNNLIVVSEPLSPTNAQRFFRAIETR